METRLHIHDHKPATMAAKMIGSVCWLEIKQGEDVISLAMPSRMDAAARMIAEAFNAHMHGGPITKLGQGGPAFPSGGGAIAIALAQGEELSAGVHPEISGTNMAVVTAIADHVDKRAARAVERRDLP